MSTFRYSEVIGFLGFLASAFQYPEFPTFRYFWAPMFAAAIFRRFGISEIRYVQISRFLDFWFRCSERSARRAFVVERPRDPRGISMFLDFYIMIVRYADVSRFRDCDTADDISWRFRCVFAETPICCEGRRGFTIPRLTHTPRDTDAPRFRYFCISGLRYSVFRDSDISRFDIPGF